MTGFCIRTLRGDDLPTVVSIWNDALVRNPLTEDRFVRMVLADPDYWPGEDSGFFVATRGGTVAGFLRAIIRRVPNDRLGLEPEDGFIPYLAVDPVHQRRGIGTLLLNTALDYFGRHGRKRIWVCGTTTSAPGSISPGVDVDAYAAALALFKKHGFVVNQQGFSMSREVVDFDVAAFEHWAWESGRDIKVESLTPARVQDLFEFLAVSLPGSWNLAARGKIQSGGLGEMLIALSGDKIVGYCQWSGEHFGPFGVAPHLRGQRIGAKLFTESVRRIRAADGRTVWFNWADEKAKRFYDRFGLHVTRRFSVLLRQL
jgi:mycothiol synthase